MVGKTILDVQTLLKEWEVIWEPPSHYSMLHTQPLMGGMWGARLGAGEARAMWGRWISHLWETTWVAMLQDNNTFSHR